MEINRKNTTVFLNSSVIVITSTFLFFVLSIYKDYKDAKFIFEDNLFNVGVLTCLFILPTLALLTFLISKIKTDITINPVFHSRFKFLLRCNAIIVLIDIIGIILLLHPFKILNYSDISYMYITLGGILFGVFLFILLNIYLKKGLN